jgi:hypothetical protein
MKTNRTFGVEIEMNGQLYKNHDKPGYMRTHDFRGCESYPDFFEIKLQPGWKCVYDSSCGQESHYGGSEFVSPPLIDTHSIMRQICEIVGKSKRQISFVNSGLHIHVGAQDLYREDLLNLAKFCRHFSKQIYSFVHPSRYHNRFCKPMQIGDAQMDSQYSMHRSLEGTDRYVGCNISAYDKHGTVEYRHSESTLNYNKICALVDLFTKITDFIAKNRGNTKVKSPRKTFEKKIFLLDLVGVREESKKILTNIRY